MAVRVPVIEAFDIYSKGAESVVVVAVSDSEIAAAMRLYYYTTHNVTEGAGAAPVAALLQQRDAMRGKTVGLILSGGNVDADIFTTVSQGVTPEVA